MKSDVKFTPPFKVATNPGGPENQPAFPPVVDSSGRPHGEDIVCQPLGEPEDCKATAKWIADCLNGCEQLKSERDELLEALEDCRDLLCAFHRDHPETLKNVTAERLEKSLQTIQKVRGVK